jgi:hypothetical protein
MNQNPLKRATRLSASLPIAPAVLRAASAINGESASRAGAKEVGVC